MQQAGSTHRHGVGRRQAAVRGGSSGEIGNPSRVAGPPGRAQIGEVPHGLERRVELVVVEPPLQFRLFVDELLPVNLARRVAEHVGRDAAERVDNRGIELLAPTSAGHFHRRIRSVEAVEHLDDVRELEQPHRERDCLAAHPAGHALAVPTGEHLLQRVAHIGAEPEPNSHLGRGQAVRQEDLLDPLSAGRDQLGAETDAMKRWAAHPDVAKHEPEHGQAGQVHPAAVGAEGDVVTEPRRELRGVGHATHPGQGCRVVQRATVVGLDTEVTAQTTGDDPRPEHVLHGLPQPQVRGKREGPDEVRQPQL